MSKTLIICHVVFTTKGRRPVLNPDKDRELYSFFYSILKKNNCWTYRINGMTDHVHLLFDLTSSITLADLIKELKIDSHKWLSKNEYFPNFTGWGVGYFAVSVSPREKESVIDYIINQKIHHAGKDSLTEIEDLINENGMKWFIDDWI